MCQGRSRDGSTILTQETTPGIAASVRVNQLGSWQPSDTVYPQGGGLEGDPPNCPGAPLEVHAVLVGSGPKTFTWPFLPQQPSQPQLRDQGEGCARRLCVYCDLTSVMEE